MNKILIAAVLAATALSSTVADAQSFGRGRNNAPAMGRGGCYAGEQSARCRQRLTVQKRSKHTYVYRNGRYEDSSGAAIAGGILGFILGAAIAGSTQDRDYYYSHRNDRQWRSRCQSSYNNFDYRTGTYMGGDGYRHYCTR